ncbi:MAG: beta-ketoacyl synthase chain length factor [Bacteroidota bacterium]
MLKTDVYINGAACVSPVKTNDDIDIPDEATVVNNNTYLKCIEPLYKKYIDPMTARRMSRVVKIGLYSAKSCLEDSGVELPDAIVTGTGLGCIEDTEKFIDNIFRNDEKLLNPTPFIQSTHNTIGSQIALLLKCHNYNITYSQRGLTFESALVDSLLLLKEKAFENVLLGGVDEITNYSFQIMKRLGHWKRENVNRMNLLESQTKGSIAGEGAAFFLISDKTDKNTYAKIVSVKTINKPQDIENIKHIIHEFLADCNIGISDIDLALFGFSGDKDFDTVYHELVNTSFHNNACGYFKHLCGEYHTASSFAMWLAATIIKKQHVPEMVKIKSAPVAKQFKNILIYNHYRNIQHSFLLLQHV